MRRRRGLGLRSDCADVAVVDRAVLEEVQVEDAELEDLPPHRQPQRTVGVWHTGRSTRPPRLRSAMRASQVAPEEAGLRRSGSAQLTLSTPWEYSEYPVGVLNSNWP